MDTTQLLKAFEAIALLLPGAVFVVWQLRSTERDLRRSRAQRLAREAQERLQAQQAGTDGVQPESPGLVPGAAAPPEPSCPGAHPPESRA